MSSSRARFHGYDPKAIIELNARPGEGTLRTEDILEQIEKQGMKSLVMISGVNYLTNQFYDLQKIAAAAHQKTVSLALILLMERVTFL